MKKFLTFAKRVSKDDEGATAIEYGLLAALIAVAIITALNTVSDQLKNTFSSVSAELETANDEAGD